MKAATAPAKVAKFRCRHCGALAPVDQMQLDAEGAEICPECYLKEPPAVDVDGVFAEVAASYAQQPAAAPAKAELLTQLGAALGCKDTCTDPEAKVDGFPARCWYNGPFEPAPRAPKVQLEYMTMMDREARDLAERGRADIIRFAQMMSRVRGQK
jgi:hypothetical protein